MDLGTTNTGVARWDEVGNRPSLLELPAICRQPGGEDHLEAPRLVPSATHAIEDDRFWAKVGRWGIFRKRYFWGRLAHIGRVALEMNDGQTHPNFAASFKPYLAREALRPLARLGNKTLTARDVAYRFIRELLHEVKLATGTRIRDLVVTTPVDAYEAYRAELVDKFKRLGVKRLRFIDEPVAAAIGYGLTINRGRLVLVVDYGGGTLDLALVSLEAKTVQEGTCEVLAKDGRPVGGRLVDQWLLEEFCRRLDYPLTDDPADELTRFWYRLMLTEACRVKEAVFFKTKAAFYMTPPEHMRSFEARIRGEEGPLEVNKDDIVEILTRNGLYREIQSCLDNVLEQAQRHDIAPEDIEDVLMVGGSTLLPNVYTQFEERFGRDRVRAWQPFEAVAYGACAFAADSFSQSDFIVHDYAFVTYNSKTHEPEHTVIIPKGTRIPTKTDFWRNRLVPTCSLGVPEEIFKLVICEIGNNNEGERKFTWDASGNIHKLGGRQGGTGERLIVPLNESNPTLGFLKPPHSPSDRKPRLDISFSVNTERWLCATVIDLKTKKNLMKDETVVRLL